MTIHSKPATQAYLDGWNCIYNHAHIIDRKKGNCVNHVCNECPNEAKYELDGKWLCSEHYQQLFLRTKGIVV